VAADASGGVQGRRGRRELEIADRLAILAGGRVALDTPRGALGSDDVQRLYAAHTEDAAL
jgi:hypothetical protein